MGLRLNFLAGIVSGGGGTTVSFVAQPALLTSKTYRSETVAVPHGVPLGSTISIVNGTYSRNYQAYTASAGTINPGDALSLQANASGSASTDVVVTVTINGVAYTWTLTTAALLLDAVPGAVVAWSASRQLKTSFVGTPMTTSAGNVTAINDQIGSRNVTPVGTLAVGTGTIGSSAFVKFNGTTNKGSFTSLALGTSNFTMAFAVGAAAYSGAGGLGPIIGRAGGTTAILGTGGSQIDFQSDNAEQGWGTSFGLSKGFHCLVVTRSGNTFQYYVDGELMGALGSFSFTLSGNWTLDQLGAYFGSTSFSSMGFGEGIIWNSALTAGQIATVVADMKNAYPNTICIDQTLGNDSNIGWNDQAPLKTIGSIRAFVFRRGIGIYLKRGEVWRRDPLSFQTSNQSGAAGSPIYVGAYGSGANPKIIGSEKAAGAWTNTTGTEYSTTITGLAGTGGVWSEQIGVPEVIAGRPGVSYTYPNKTTVMPVGTAGSLPLGSYAVSGTALTVNVGGDPTGVYNIEVGHNGGLSATGGDTIHPAAPFMEFHDIDVMYAPYDGIGYEGANPSIYNCKASYCTQDGFSGSAVNIYEEGCVAIRTGDTASRSSGSPGDGFSLHGGANALRVGCTAIETSKAGFDDVDDAITVNYGFYARGCGRNIFTSNPDAGVTGGLRTFKWGTIVHTVTDGAYAIENTTIQNVIIDHTTIINTGTAPGTVAIGHNSTGTMSVTNTLCYGFATRLLKGVGSGALAADYNLAESGDVYSGVSAGAHDLTATPIFVNAGASDYHLDTGSPGIGVASDRGNIGAL